MDNKSLRLLAVGDIMMGDHPICIGHGVGSTISQKKPTYLFESVADLLHQGDIVFGNLEAVVSQAGVVENRLESVQLRANPETVNALSNAGFTVLSVANNHMMDHGEVVFEETVDLLRENSLVPAGLRSCGPICCDPVLISSGDLCVVFLAYSLVPGKRGSVESPYCFATEQEILSDVRSVVSEERIIVVSLHWGHEFMDRPSPQQVAFARQLIDEGVMIVLGHHSHVFQRVERYRHGVIAYSLGNFVFDMWQLPTRRSGILCCELGKDGIRDVSIYPVQIEQCRPILTFEERRSVILDSEQLSEERMVLREEQMKYLAEARRCRRNYRRDIWGYFLRNLHRYSFSFAIQLILSPIRKWFLTRPYE